MPGLIWCHSGYSFNRGAAKLEELVEHAASQGWKQIALTDLNGIYGAVWFWDFAQDAGIRPIIGAEFETSKAALQCSWSRLLKATGSSAGS